MLTCHVVPGRVPKAEVPVGAAIKTVQDHTFSANASLHITGQRRRTLQITDTGVFASNGVIHAVDRVLLPAAD